MRRVVVGLVLTAALSGCAETGIGVPEGVETVVDQAVTVALVPVVRHVQREFPDGPPTSFDAWEQVLSGFPSVTLVGPDVDGDRQLDGFPIRLRWLGSEVCWDGQQTRPSLCADG